MKVCFTGDLFLGGDLLNKNVEQIVSSKLFQLSDKRIVNLEQPISDSNTVEDKCTLYTGSYATSQLIDLNIDAVNLAHNHIQDKGLEGIKETISHLDKSKIGHFGSGKNLKEARKPYWLNSEVALFGYCEFAKPYLKQIAVADSNTPGINPLRYENIVKDLEALQDNKKAILYFHWGREHVSLPPFSDIELAKKLLEHEKVLLIVGMHAHRPQGYIEHNGKRAYMCLGNFIFPNFYISPPTQIYYPNSPIFDCDITRQYHQVSKVTYKKWRYLNRVSIILSYDLDRYQIEHDYVLQSDDQPNIVELRGIKLKLMSALIVFLSKIYKLPKWLYIPLEKINTKIGRSFWFCQIVFFQLRQMGVVAFTKKAVNKFSGKRV